MLLGSAILAPPEFAQAAPTENNAAAMTAHTIDDGRSRRGANSFTQAQARDHIAKSGSTDVTSLTKDQHGLWRGTAKKGGNTFKVGLDFKGNVTISK